MQDDFEGEAGAEDVPFDSPVQPDVPFVTVSSPTPLRSTVPVEKPATGEDPIADVVLARPYPDFVSVADMTHSMFKLQKAHPDIWAEEGLDPRALHRKRNQLTLAATIDAAGEKAFKDPEGAKRLMQIATSRIMEDTGYHTMSRKQQDELYGYVKEDFLNFDPVKAGVMQPPVQPPPEAPAPAFKLRGMLQSSLPPEDIARLDTDPSYRSEIVNRTRSIIGKDKSISEQEKIGAYSELAKIELDGFTPQTPEQKAAKKAEAGGVWSTLRGWIVDPIVQGAVVDPVKAVGFVSGAVSDSASSTVSGYADKVATAIAGDNYTKYQKEAAAYYEKNKDTAFGDAGILVKRAIEDPASAFRDFTNILLRSAGLATNFLGVGFVGGRVAQGTALAGATSIGGLSSITKVAAASAATQTLAQAQDGVVAIDKATDLQLVKQPWFQEWERNPANSALIQGNPMAAMQKYREEVKRDIRVAGSVAGVAAGALAGWSVGTKGGVGRLIIGQGGSEAASGVPTRLPENKSVLDTVFSTNTLGDALLGVATDAVVAGTMRGVQRTIDATKAEEATIAKTKEKLEEDIKQSEQAHAAGLDAAIDAGRMKVPSGMDGAPPIPQDSRQASIDELRRKLATHQAQAATSSVEDVVAKASAPQGMRQATTGDYIDFNPAPQQPPTAAPARAPAPQGMRQATTGDYIDFNPTAAQSPAPQQPPAPAGISVEQEMQNLMNRGPSAWPATPEGNARLDTAVRRALGLPQSPADTGTSVEQDMRGLMNRGPSTWPATPEGNARLDTAVRRALGLPPAPAPQGMRQATTGDYIDFNPPANQQPSTAAAPATARSPARRMQALNLDPTLFEQGAIDPVTAKRLGMDPVLHEYATSPTGPQESQRAGLTNYTRKVVESASAGAKPGNPLGMTSSTKTRLLKMGISPDIIGQIENGDTSVDQGTVIGIGAIVKAIQDGTPQQVQEVIGVFRSHAAGQQGTSAAGPTAQQGTSAAGRDAAGQQGTSSTPVPQVPRAPQVDPAQAQPDTAAAAPQVEPSPPLPVEPPVSKTTKPAKALTEAEQKLRGLATEEVRGKLGLPDEAAPLDKVEAVEAAYQGRLRTIKDNAKKRAVAVRVKAEQAAKKAANETDKIKIRSERDKAIKELTEKRDNAIVDLRAKRNRAMAKLDPGINMQAPMRQAPLTDAHVTDGVRKFRSEAHDMLISNGIDPATVRIVPMTTRDTVVGTFSTVIRDLGSTILVKVNPERAPDDFHSELRGKLSLVILSRRMNAAGDMNTALNRLFNALGETQEGQKIVGEVKEAYENNQYDLSDPHVFAGFRNSVLAKAAERLPFSSPVVESFYSRAKTLFRQLIGREKLTLDDMMQMLRASEHGLTSTQLRKLTAAEDRYRLGSKAVLFDPEVHAREVSTLKDSLLRTLLSPTFSSMSLVRAALKQLGAAGKEISTRLDGRRTAYINAMHATTPIMQKLTTLMMAEAKRLGTSMEHAYTEIGRGLNAMDALARFDTLSLWTAKLDDTGQALLEALRNDYDTRMAAGMSVADRLAYGSAMRTQLEGIVAADGNPTMKWEGFQGFRTREDAEAAARGMIIPERRAIVDTVKQLNNVTQDMNARSGRVDPLTVGFWRKDMHIPQLIDKTGTRANFNEQWSFDILGRSQFEGHPGPSQATYAFQEGTAGGKSYQPDPFGALEAAARRAAKNLSDNEEAKAFLDMGILSSGTVFDGQITTSLMPHMELTSDRAPGLPVFNTDKAFAMAAEAGAQGLVYVDPSTGHRYLVKVKPTEWLGVTDVPAIFKTSTFDKVQKATGTYGRWQTLYNPKFMLIDPLRSLSEATLHLAGDQGLKTVARMYRHMFSPSSGSNAFDLARRINAMSVADRQAWANAHIKSSNAMEQYASERILNNNWLSQSDYLRIFSERTAIGKLAETKSKLATSDTMTAKTARAYPHAAETWANVTDNGIRLAFYAAQRGNGVDMHDALRVTRDNMNWDNRSVLGQMQGLVYVFSNPRGIGFHKLLFNDLWKDRQAPVSYSRDSMGRLSVVFDAKATGSQLNKYKIAMLFTKGVMFAAMADALSGEDENGRKLWSKWATPENLITKQAIPLFGVDGVSLPMQYGMERTVTALGQLGYAIMAGYALPGESLKKYMAQLIREAPMASGLDIAPNDSHAMVLARGFIPSVLQPITDIISNTNWTGNQIYASPYGSAQGKYKSDLGFANTPPFFDWLAKTLRESVGIDRQPEIYQHIMSSLGGANAIAGTLSAIAQGDTEGMRKSIIGSEIYNPQFEQQFETRRAGVVRQTINALNAERNAARILDEQEAIKAGGRPKKGGRRILGPREQEFLNRVPGTRAILDKAGRLLRKTNVDAKVGKVMGDKQAVRAATQAKTKDIAKLYDELELMGLHR